MLVAATIAADAQRPPGDPDYKLGPAIAGNNGRVFVGTQRGTILYATSTSAGVSITDSATAGGLLPPETEAIWALSMPNRQTQPALVVGIASYDEGGSSRYGAIRSTDLGTSWTLVKDGALADERFRPTNRFWDSTGLTELTWLADAQNGWAFGPGGIVATSDGGLTWSVRFARDAAARTNIQALSFRDPLNGVASIGWSPEQRFRLTSDGGVTWRSATTPSSPLGAFRVNQIDWIGNQFRAFVFDRTALSDRGKITTFIYRSTDFGDWWEGKPKGTITVEQTVHTELLWLNPRTGFMVMRSGQIAVTQDAGNVWTRIQEADSAGYPMPISMGSGFGYNSILLDNRYIVQAATLRTDGALDTLVQWDLGAASVGTESVDEVTAAIAPTPSRDIARLHLAHPASTGARMSIVDMTGAPRRFETIESGATSVAIDVAGLGSGIYRVVVEEPGRRTSAPLVVTR